MSNGILDFTEDLSQAEAPPPLPSGPYPAEIISAQQKTSNTTRKEYANIQFRIPAASYPADFTDGDPDGLVLSYNRLLMEDTPSMRWRWRKFLEAVGGTITRRVDLSDLIGLTATVDVTHQEYEGEMRAQISRVMPS